MGRTVICDEELLDSLENISTDSGIVPGFILGQFTGQRDYVVHLPKIRFLPPDEEESTDQACVTTISKLGDIREMVVAEQARTVTRMLPGGMWILGYYIVSPADVFADKNSITKLKTLAQAVHTCTKGNIYLSGADPSNQMLILNFCSLTKKYSCKTLDMSSLNSSFRPADWKFKSDITRWLQVDCRFKLNTLTPFVVSSGNLTPKKKFQEVLAQFKEHLDGLIFSINKHFCSSEAPLISIKPPIKDDEEEEEKDQGVVEEKPEFYELGLYDFKEPPERTAEKPKKPKLISERSLVELCGILASRVFLNEKSSAEDAVKAVKEDLMRSLAARLEMHWQTCEEPEASKTRRRFLIRYPPRRVLFTPENYGISFSEYIFEGETERDALATICETLGFEDGKIIAFEKLWKVPKLYDKTDGKTTKGSVVKDTSKNVMKEKEMIQEKLKVSAMPGSSKIVTYGLFGALCTFILSIIAHLYFNS